MKWFWPNQVNLTWTSIVTTQNQANNGGASFLHPKLIWEPPFPRYHDQASLQHMKNLNMREITSSFSSYHEVHHLKLPWVFQLKPPWDSTSQATMSISIQASLRFTIPSYPWDIPSQDIMRFTISSYHEIHISSYHALILSHQVYYTRSDHKIHLQANLVHHVLIHFRFIYVRELASPIMFMSKCRRKPHHNLFIMTLPSKPYHHNPQ